MSTEDDEEALSAADGLLMGFVNFIIRPPRAHYSMSDLGPTSALVGNVLVTRRDFDVVNSRKERLKCSIWEPQTDRSEPLPCVIYLHGRGSCRVEALSIDSLVLPFQTKLVGVDLSGAGKSEGQYVSLGILERDDVEAVVDHLITNRIVSQVAFWGYSMGAATAILYSGSKPKHKAQCMVLDSSYASFEKLAEITVDQMELPPGVPKKLLLSMGMRRVRRLVKERAGFDIVDLQPAKSAKRCEDVPCVIVHGTDDEAVSYTHAQIIFDSYACPEKALLTIPHGDHNTRRPQWVEDRAFTLIHKHLKRSPLEFCEALKSRGNSHLLNAAYNDAINLYTQLISVATEQLGLQQDSIPAAATEPNGISRLKQAEVTTNSTSDHQQQSKKEFWRDSALAVSSSKRKVLSIFTSFRKDKVGRARATNNGYLSSEAARTSNSTLPSYTVGYTLDEDVEKALKQLLVSVYSNRSLSYASLNDGTAALEDARKAIELDPSWPRGYQREAAALRLAGKLSDAMAALERGLALDGSNRALLELKASIQETIGSDS